MTDTLLGASFIFGPMIAFLVWHFTHPEKKESPPEATCIWIQLQNKNSTSTGYPCLVALMLEETLSGSCETTNQSALIYACFSNDQRAPWRSLFSPQPG